MLRTIEAGGAETLHDKFHDVEQIIRTFGLAPAEIGMIVSRPEWHEMEYARSFGVADIKWGIFLDREKSGSVTFEVWFPVDQDREQDRPHAIIQFICQASGESEWVVHHQGLQFGAPVQWFDWLLPEDDSEIPEEEAYSLIGDILKRFIQESASGDLPPILSN